MLETQYRGGYLYLFSIPRQRHFGSFKLTTVELFTPQKLANAARLPQRCLLSVYRHTTAMLRGWLDFEAEGTGRQTAGRCVSCLAEQELPFPMVPPENCWPVVEVG